MVRNLFFAGNKFVCFCSVHIVDSGYYIPRWLQCELLCECSVPSSNIVYKATEFIYAQWKIAYDCANMDKWGRNVHIVVIITSCNHMVPRVSAVSKHVNVSTNCSLQKLTMSWTVRAVAYFLLQVRNSPCDTAQSPCILHGSGHLRMLCGYALCPQGCAVWYRADVSVADMHATTHCLNGP